MALPFAIKFYASKQWKQTRAGYIDSVNGLCERCKRAGYHVPGYIVHHKEELKPHNINDPNIALSWDNLEYLCLVCHQIHHAEKYGNTAVGLKFGDDGKLMER